MIGFLLDTLLIIAGFLLLMGKCSWLVAAFNTANASGKRPYHEKQLCHTVGVVLLVIALLNMLKTLLHLQWFSTVSFILSLAVLLGGIFYANQFCKTRKR